MDPDPTKPKPIVLTEGEEKPLSEVKSSLRPVSERDQRIKDSMANTRKAFADSKEKMYAFQDEIIKRYNYIKSRYPDYGKRIILHVLTGSGLSISETNVIEEDFPGEDSIEKFVDYLAKKYGKQSKIPPTE